MTHALLHQEEDLLAVQQEIEETRGRLERLLETPAVVVTAEHRRVQSIQLALLEIARLETLHAELAASRPPGDQP